MTQHTPGPWRVIGPVQKGIFGKPATMHGVGYGIHAAEPRAFGGTPVVESGLSLPNARLVASAPELLMAAKQVEAWLTSGVKFLGQQGEETAEYPLQWLRVAIAKAEQGER